MCDKNGRFLAKTPQKAAFSFLFSLSVIYPNKRKSEKTKSKKIEHFCKGAEKLEISKKFSI